jgi:hypothetical protein
VRSVVELKSIMIRAARCHGRAAWALVIALRTKTLFRCRKTRSISARLKGYVSFVRSLLPWFLASADCDMLLRKLGSITATSQRTELDNQREYPDHYHASNQKCHGGYVVLKPMHAQGYPPFKNQPATRIQIWKAKQTLNFILRPRYTWREGKVLLSTS